MVSYGKLAPSQSAFDLYSDGPRGVLSPETKSDIGRFGQMMGRRRAVFACIDGYCSSQGDTGTSPLPLACRRRNVGMCPGSHLTTMTLYEPHEPQSSITSTACRAPTRQEPDATRACITPRTLPPASYPVSSPRARSGRSSRRDRWGGHPRWPGPTPAARAVTWRKRTSRSLATSPQGTSRAVGADGLTLSMTSCLALPLHAAARARRDLPGQQLCAPSSSSAAQTTPRESPRQSLPARSR